jgi:hypothetical protein
VGKLVREGKADHEIHVLQARHPHVLDQPDPARAIQRAIDRAREDWADEMGRDDGGVDHGATAEPPADTAPAAGDFYSYMPMRRYIFSPTGDMWPGSSVNARCEAPKDETGATITRKVRQQHKDGTVDYVDVPVYPTAWVDEHHPIEQLTWAPGEPMVLPGRLVSAGGWIKRAGCACFNLYMPSQLTLGDPDQAEPWIEHVQRVFGDDIGHIVARLAHRVQHPEVKINHALVMGGKQGIGKDTVLEPVKHAIGPWNFADVSPKDLLGRFNGFVRSVVLRINEARDLGDFDRYAFYDHLKMYIAAPPDVIRCDEKNIREYPVFNVTGVIITSNHKRDGIYLPEDDRRHFVAWSELSKEDFTAAYWNQLYRWYAFGGIGHVAAYLSRYDLADFDPKAPPPKTAAFYEILDANRAPEDAELADVLDKLSKDGQRPQAVTLIQLANFADQEFADWLRDRKNSRQIPHRLETAGYVAVRNPAAKDGQWIIQRKRQAIYARADLCVRDRFIASRPRIRPAGRWMKSMKSMIPYLYKSIHQS